MNDYLQMSKAISYLVEHSTEQPSLELLADIAGLSPAYFQRKFVSWVGISPKSYLQYLTMENARDLLSRGNNVLDVATDTGLSGSGRLHDLCVNLDAASPGEIKNHGAGLDISYGFGITPFGECILAYSRRGICYLAFISSGENEQAIQGLINTWPGADLFQNQAQSGNLIRQIFDLSNTQQMAPLRAYVKGTRFQLRVWRALLQIPKGELTTYGDIAIKINHPRAARAAGSAVGTNPLAYLIPCHRVIRNTGEIGEYRWGCLRKRALLAYEITRKRHLMSTNR